MTEETAIKLLFKNIDQLTETEVTLIKRIAKRIHRDSKAEEIEDIIEKNIVQKRNSLLEKAISLDDLAREISSFEREIPLKLNEITGEQLHNLVLNEKQRALNERNNLSDILES